MLDQTVSRIPQVGVDRTAGQPARRSIDGRAAVRHRVRRGACRGPARGRPLIPTAPARATADRRSASMTPMDRIARSSSRRVSPGGSASASCCGSTSTAARPTTSRRSAPPSDLEPGLVKRLANEPPRADLTQYADHLHLVLEAMEPPKDPERDGRIPVRRALDVVAGHDWVVTVHDGPLDALEHLDAVTEGETRFGAMDAAGLMAAIADEVIADYFRLVEGIEREIDELDERALRRRPRNDVLARIVELRRRIGTDPPDAGAASDRVRRAGPPGDGAPR